MITVALGLIALVSGCGKKENNAPGTSSSPHAAPAKSGGIDRYQWNLNTLVVPYLQKGHRDPSWDEPATNALALFASIRSSPQDNDEGMRGLIASHLRDAVIKGCVDPMVLYLHNRYVLGFQQDTTDALMAEAHKKAVNNLRQYPCAPIRQFYITLRTSESINAATGGKAADPEVNRFRVAAMSSLYKFLQEPDIPAIEAHEACRDFFASLNRNAMIQQFYSKLEPILLTNWPNEAFVYQIKGRHHIDEAWRARGSGYSDSVTKDGWKLFRDQLDQAEEALEKAWKLNPRDPQIAREMISLELGQGKGRERMELWFNRAMALDTNYYEPCKSKLNYLEPKWYGSAADMLAFARECAATEKWGGNVPLLALDAHDTLAAYAKREGNTNYWRNPRVWPDLQSAFEKFFSLNPNAAGWRHNYAWYAYSCERWDDFNKQLTLFGTTNYTYFGGREAFEHMVKTAREKSAKPPAD